MRKLVLVVLTLTLMLTLIPAQAQVPKASLDSKPVGVKDFWGVMDVELGKKIQLKVKVSVASDSPVDLDGFWIVVYFKRPSGGFTLPEWFDFTDEYISKGSSKSYTLKTSTEADELGTWTAYVTLKDKDKSVTLDQDSKDFKVTAKPEATITIEEITGYSAVAGLIAAGIYIARRGLV